MKMDEIQNKNTELEIQIKKIEAYDKELYEVARRDKTLQ